MARTIADAFSTLKTNLEITGLQQTTVAERQQSVRTRPANPSSVF